MTTMTMTARRASSVPILCHVSFLWNALFLLSAHVLASHETPASFWDRLRLGPEGLTTMDLVFFSAVILLAFEALDFISKNSGSKSCTKSLS
jgi:hypothetical protein